MFARLQRSLLLTVVMCAVIAPAAFGAPTVVNSNFDVVPIACVNGYAYQGTTGCDAPPAPHQDYNSTPGFGWTLGINDGLTGPGTSFIPPPFDGLPFTQAVFLQGPAVADFLTQEVGGFSAGSYMLSFYLGSRYIDCCGFDGNQTVQALIDGNVIGTWNLTSFTPFTLRTVPFTVTTGGTHTLTFRGIRDGDHTAFLSAVNITPTSGTGWDATRDFAAFNPNGAWSYGDGITGTTFTLYPFYNPDCEDTYGASGVVCWTTETSHDHTPFVSFNTTGSYLNYSTVVDPPDVLLIHPGMDDGQDTIVQWTAPAASYYNISGFFEILDTSPSGIIGLVFLNGTPLYSRELLGPPAQHPDQVGGRENFSFFRLFLNAGDVIAFGVNKDGDYRFDSTGFNATITTTGTAPPCAVCSR